MILFVDPLGSEMLLALARPDKSLVAERSVDLSGDEFERFLDEIESFLSESGITYADLSAIVCVNGPGPFTGMRVVTLTLSTIAAIRQIPSYAVNAFETFRLSGFAGPYLIRANRWEYAFSADGEPFVLKALDAIPEGTYFGIGSEKDFANGGVSVQFSRNVAAFLRSYAFESPVSRIDPIYIKKPNITLS